MEKSWKLPECLWEVIKDKIPEKIRSPRGGRPPKDPRLVMEGIFYSLRTGTHWKAIPKPYPPGSTCHRYFQEWAAAGVFDEVWLEALTKYDQARGIRWKWQSVDGAMTKAPLGGEKNRKEPYRPRKVGHQALLADGWRGNSVGIVRGRGQRARLHAL